MQSLFDAACAEQVKQRVQRLRADSARQWGRMSPAQMLAHCAVGLQMAVGDVRPRRILIGRLIGPAIKRQVMKDGVPFRRNAPTMKELVVDGEPDFEAERTRLLGLVERIAAGGSAGCTTHPHAFFGRMTPAEWGVLTFKHLDHHLRQFGV